MPKKDKAARPAPAKKSRVPKPKSAKRKLKAAKIAAPPAAKAQVLSSVIVYEGSLFRVRHDKLIEPGGKHSERDVIRHNGSVVILALDSSKSKKDPWVVIERQYRHAANQYLWEVPAGKLDEGEDAFGRRAARIGRRDRLSRKKVEAAGRVLRQPRFSGRVDDGFHRRRVDSRRCAP